MSDPVPVVCPEGEFTKVATAIIGGYLWRVKISANYLYTYRQTGTAAPTLVTQGREIFKDGDIFELDYNELVDVYIWCLKDAGEVELHA